jgi:ribosomal protein S18 acetylase RimI-like enzyme
MTCDSKPAGEGAAEMPATHLREFRTADFEELLQLDQECFSAGIAYSREELMHYVSRPRACTVVAEDESGRIRGFIVAETGRTPANPPLPLPLVAGHVITIDVALGDRRAGIGTMLIAEIEERLQRTNCDRIYLEVAVDNHAAISFYKRRGYSIMKTLPRYYDNELDGLRMGKKLTRQGFRPDITPI